MALKITEPVATHHDCRARRVDAGLRCGSRRRELEHVLRGTSEALEAQLYSPFAFGGPEPLPANAPVEQRTFMTHVVLLGEKDLDDALRSRPRTTCRFRSARTRVASSTR